MIRLAVVSDINELRNIWKMCFGDADAYLDLYFSCMFDPLYTLVYQDDQKIAAMLQMLPCGLQSGETVKPAQYIFAAATVPEFRNRGIMAQLIAEAVRIGKERGQALSVLKPTNRKLFGFYEKLGYKPDFLIQRISFTRQELSHIVQDIDVSECSLSRGTAEEIHELRERYLKNHDGAVVFPVKHLAFQMMDYRYTNGGILMYKDCYALYKCAHKSVTCVEISYTADSMKTFCALLLNHFAQKDKFHFILPVDAVMFSKTSISNPCGMSLKMEPVTMKMPYLNLTLA